MGKHESVDARDVDEIFQLEDLLGRFNRDVAVACKVQCMVITINHRPHRRGFWYKRMTEFSLWLLHKVAGFYIVFPDGDN